MNSKGKKKLNYITIVWEELPDDLSFYVIPSSQINSEDLQMLKACHNNWIGSSYTDTKLANKEEIDKSLVRLHCMLSKSEESWFTDQYKSDIAENMGIDLDELDGLIGSWSEFKLSTEHPIVLPRSRFYRTGYMP